MGRAHALRQTPLRRRLRLVALKFILKLTRREVQITSCTDNNGEGARLWLVMALSFVTLAADGSLIVQGLAGQLRCGRRQRREVSGWRRGTSRADLGEHALSIARPGLCAPFSSRGGLTVLLDCQAKVYRLRGPYSSLLQLGRILKAVRTVARL